MSRFHDKGPSDHSHHAGPALRRRRWPGLFLVASVTLLAQPARAAVSATPWTAAEHRYVLRLIRRQVSPGMVKGGLGPTPPRLARACDEGVFISLFWRGRRYMQVGGQSTTLLGAVTDASTRMARRCRPLPWSRTALGNGRIKVDVVTQWEAFRPLSTRPFLSQLSIGIEGFVVRTPDQCFAFVPLTVLRHRAHVDPLAALFSEAGYPAADVYADNVRLERFHTHAFVEATPGGEPLPLFRGNVLLTKVDSRIITRSFLSAGAWLLSVQRADGTFLYQYDATTQHSSRDYNIVRHAAATLPLYMLYDVTKDGRFLHAGDKCLAYTRRYVKQSAAALPYAHVMHKGMSSLGTAAILLQGLARRASATEDVSYNGLMERLGNFIRLMTAPDGRVHKTLKQLLEGRLPAKQPRYYPGEAMFALCLLHRHSAKEQWVKCARRIAAYQFGEFVRGEPPDHWVMKGLGELYRITGEKKYADWCLRMADVYCDEQILPGQAAAPDYVGGFEPRELPSVCAAATRVEGLSAAYEAAVLTRRPAKKYGDAILRSARFQIQQQFRPENSFFVEQPERVLGAYRSDPVRMTVRLDYAQHGIASLLAAAYIARVREAEENAAPPKTPTINKTP